jgi:ArsR family transcriptional regulator
MTTLRAQVNVHSRLVGEKAGDPLETGSLNALAALAQRTRLAIFRMLVEQEPRGMAAGAIALAVGAPQNTVSAHLGVLARADMVAASRHSRSIIYRANLKRMQSLIEYLVSNCCEGTQACSVSSLIPVCDGTCATKTDNDSKTT